MPTSDDGLFSAWRNVHHVDAKWLATVAASWTALSLFAAVTVPIKYPYEARAQVVDSGVVIGLLVPLAVMNLMLEEGPEDLIRTASLRLSRVRFAVAGGYVAVASLMSVLLAFAVSLPRGLVLADALLLAALSLLSTTLFTVRLGWLLPSLVGFTMSAPGLIPFQYNPMYNREISSVFIVAVVVAVAAAMLLYLRDGATGARWTKTIGGRGQPANHRELQTDRKSQ